MRILLNPGPVTLSARVRKSLTRGDWCHREPEFAELTCEINLALTSVYESLKHDYRAVTITGSGTSAVEAMLATFAPDKQKTLVVANGVYGERIARILELHSKPHSVIRSEWLDEMDIEAVRKFLATNGDVAYVATVHHETTTGRLNDIGRLSAACKPFGVKLLVDAVSSFGAEAIEATEWGIAALAGTANKCLHGVPGLSFVVASKEAWDEEPANPGSLYLDLRTYAQTQHAGGFSPFTPAVQTAFALSEALAELHEEGGWKARQAIYLHRADTIAGTLKAHGISSIIPANEFSSVLRTYRLPKTVTYEELHDELKAEGFVIYAGQGTLASQVFRVANMGSIDNNELSRLCESFAKILPEPRA